MYAACVVTILVEEYCHPIHQHYKCEKTISILSMAPNSNFKLFIPPQCVFTIIDGFWCLLDQIYCFLSVFFFLCHALYENRTMKAQTHQ